MNTIKFPITFDKGRMSVLQEGTRPFYAQIIALACRIEKGELILEQTYGVKDGTFGKFRKSELLYSMSTFWPEIRLTTIDQSSADKNGVSRLVVDFTFEGN